MAKTKIEKRNGKDYQTLTDVSTICNVQQFKINLIYQNTPKLINDLINRIVNANWRIFKSAIDSSINKFVGEFVKSFQQTIYSEIAISDYLHSK